MTEITRPVSDVVPMKSSPVTNLCIVTCVCVCVCDRAHLHMSQPTAKESVSLIIYIN